jgi:hypothetical protein
MASVRRRLDCFGPVSEPGNAHRGRPRQLHGANGQSQGDAGQNRATKGAGKQDRRLERLVGIVGAPHIGVDLVLCAACFSRAHVTHTDILFSFSFSTSSN